MQPFCCYSSSENINSHSCNFNRIFHTLSGCTGKVVASHAAVARSSPAEVALIYAMHVALRWYCQLGCGVLATSELDLPSLTPLSIAGCG